MNPVLPPPPIEKLNLIDSNPNTNLASFRNNLYNIASIDYFTQFPLTDIFDNTDKINKVAERLKNDATELKKFCTEKYPESKTETILDTYKEFKENVDGIFYLMKNITFPPSNKLANRAKRSILNAHEVLNNKGSDFESLSSYIESQKNIILGIRNDLNDSKIRENVSGIDFSVWSSWGCGIDNNGWGDAFVARVNYVSEKNGTINFIFPGYDDQINDANERLEKAIEILSGFSNWDSPEGNFQSFKNEYRKKYNPKKSATEKGNGETTFFELAYLMTQNKKFNLFFKTKDAQELFSNRIGNKHPNVTNICLG